VAVERVVGAHNAVRSGSHGFHPFSGRGVAADLAEAGLVDVDPELAVVSQVVMAAWGRRP
jgi:hypothetical protein